MGGLLFSGPSKLYPLSSRFGYKCSSHSWLKLYSKPPKMLQPIHLTKDCKVVRPTSLVLLLGLSVVSFFSAVMPNRRLRIGKRIAVLLFFALITFSLFYRPKQFAGIASFNFYVNGQVLANRFGVVGVKSARKSYKVCGEQCSMLRGSLLDRCVWTYREQCRSVGNALLESDEVPIGGIESVSLNTFTSSGLAQVEVFLASQSQKSDDYTCAARALSFLGMEDAESVPYPTPLPYIMQRAPDLMLMVSEGYEAYTFWPPDGKDHRLGIVSLPSGLHVVLATTNHTLALEYSKSNTAPKCIRLGLRGNLDDTPDTIHNLCGANGRKCVACGLRKDVTEFSKSQLRSTTQSRCVRCVAMENLRVSNPQSRQPVAGPIAEEASLDHERHLLQRSVGAPKVDPLIMAIDEAKKGVAVFNPYDPPVTEGCFWKCLEHLYDSGIDIGKLSKRLKDATPVDLGMATDLLHQGCKGKHVRVDVLQFQLDKVSSVPRHSGFIEYQMYNEHYSKHAPSQGALILVMPPKDCSIGKTGHWIVVLYPAVDIGFKTPWKYLLNRHAILVEAEEGEQSDDEAFEIFKTNMQAFTFTTPGEHNQSLYHSTTASSSLENAFSSLMPLIGPRQPAVGEESWTKPASSQMPDRTCLVQEVESSLFDTLGGEEFAPEPVQMPLISTPCALAEASVPNPFNSFNFTAFTDSIMSGVVAPTPPAVSDAEQSAALEHMLENLVEFRKPPSTISEIHAKPGSDYFLVPPTVAVVKTKIDIYRARQILDLPASDHVCPTTHYTPPTYFVNLVKENKDEFHCSVGFSGIPMHILTARRIV